MLNDYKKQISASEAYSSYPKPSDSLPPILVDFLSDLRNQVALKNYTSGEGEGKERPSVSESALEVEINRLAQARQIELSRTERDVLLKEFRKTEKMFGILEPLVENRKINDIICTRFDKISYKCGATSHQTDLRFPSQEEYEAFCERLLGKANARFSTAKPIVDAMVGGFARIHAVHSSLAEGGPYLTIRLNRFASVSKDDLIAKGMAAPEMFDYLEALIKAQVTILLVGEVAVGKTTLARTLASMIPEEQAIIVIEDTREINLDHPEVRYLSTRENSSEGTGRVGAAEIIKATMRMAMNRIIFGEIRDAEAAEAFIDVCASGHSGLSTVHGRSIEAGAERLELFLGRAQKGTDERVLRKQISTAVGAIVFLNECPVTKKKRIVDIAEVNSAGEGTKIQTRKMFTYRVEESGIPGWDVNSKSSLYDERLRQLPKPFLMSRLANVVYEDGAEVV